MRDFEPQTDYASLGASCRKVVHDPEMYAW
jgi:hypothetical protein